MEADGYFYLVDRKKDMIISGGFNVYPQMIEQAIYTHPAVQEVIVIGIPDDYRGESQKPSSSCARAQSLHTWMSCARS
jgi:long-chain acyl-CoA synthetase